MSENQRTTSAQRLKHIVKDPLHLQKHKEINARFYDSISSKSGSRQSKSNQLTSLLCLNSDKICSEITDLKTYDKIMLSICGQIVFLQMG